MPLFRRVARRGFSNYPFKKEYIAVNLGRLNDVYSDGDEVSLESLREKGVIRNSDIYVKILSDGELEKKLAVKGVAMSAAARSKIEAAGGSIVDEG